MRLLAIESSLSMREYDEITYHCGNCNYKEKHISERRITQAISLFRPKVRVGGSQGNPGAVG
jgi:hypothetical protein